MPVSQRTVLRLQSLLGKPDAAALVDLLNNAANPVAANVALLGTTDDLSAASSTVATGGTPDCDAAAVEAGIDAAIDALAAEVETRLDAIEAKVDALIGAQITAGLMASS